MAGFFDFLLPQNSGLDPDQMDIARRRGYATAASTIADWDAKRATPLQIITHGLGGFQSGAQDSLDQFYKNQGTQAQGAADAVSTEMGKQDLAWQKSNGSFDAYKKNNSRFNPVDLSQWYQKPAPVAEKLGVTGLSGLDAAQINQESGFNPNAVSPKGASGIAQIMPKTAVDPGYGVKPLQGMTRIDPKTGLGDPASAPIDEQIRFMRDYRNAMPFDSVEDKLAAYNAGPGKMQQVKNGQAPMPAETAAYAPSIMRRAGVQTAMNDGSIQNDAGSIAQIPQPMAQQPIQQPTQPAQAGMPNGMSQNDYALYLSYLGERQMRSPRGGGSDLMRMGTEYNPNFKKNTDDSVSYEDWQRMTPAQKEDYKKYKTSWQPSSASGGMFDTSGADPSLTGEAYLQTLPPQMASVVKMIAEGNEKSTTVLSKMKPEEKMAMLDAVARYKSDYSANQFGANADFAYKKNAGIVRSLNVATSHLNTLSGLADALDNGDIKLLNKLANKYATETGSTAPTSFEAAKKIVADEVVKAVVGSGGGVSDREEAAASIEAASSPAQLKGVIETYKTMMRGQLNGMKLEYKNATGKDDFNKFLEEGVLEDQPADETPKGWKLIGTSGGKKVYQLPDGSHRMEQ